MKPIYFLYLFIVINIIACSQSPEDSLRYIEGYWEIADVTFTDGTKKEYSISQNIDFFDINENHTGVRKKVQPDVTGHFTTSQNIENIDIEINNNILILQYTTAYDSWKETVLTATKDKLILQNENGNIYTYRRYQPLIITE